MSFTGATNLNISSQRRAARPKAESDRPSTGTNDHGKNERGVARDLVDTVLAARTHTAGYRRTYHTDPARGIGKHKHDWIAASQSSEPYTSTSPILANKKKDIQKFVSLVPTERR